MKRMFVMLGWINSGGTRQPKWNGCQTLLAAALLLGAAAGAQAQFAAGDGSAGDPWQIETPAQLSTVSNYCGGTHTNKHFILNNDIDLQGYLSSTGAGYNAGAFWEPIGFVASAADGFRADFDGRGHKITSLKINRTNTSLYVGLFGQVATNGVVRNVGVEIDSGGSVAGNARVGALVGQLYESVMTNCYAVGQVSGAGNNVGGLVGYSQSATIKDCYATGNVSGNQYVGGLVGWNFQGKAIRCYSIGIPTGSANVNGLGAYTAGGSSEDTANFWDTNTSGTATSTMGTGTNTAAMKTRSTFAATGWDFTNVWDIISGSYPFLRSPRQTPAPGALTAFFSGTPTNGTAPLTVSFTDQTTNGPATGWTSRAKS